MLARNGLVMAFCLVLATAAVAQQPKLQVGSAAPGLDVEHWLNSDAVSIEAGKTYVVEFWATWCGPCRRAIPHLNDLHRRYRSRGLTIIGVSDEQFGTVDQFVKRQGDRMSYPVAVDRNNNTKRAWMEAAGQRGIPCSFVVDRNGRIVYIGHPMEEEFERVLRLTLAGRYDPKKEEAARPVIEAAERAVRVRNWRLAYGHFDEVITSDPTIFFSTARRKFEVMMVDEGDTDGALRYARTLVSKYADDAEALRDFARDLVVNPRYEDRHLDLAMEYAQASLRRSGDKDPEAIAVVALVQFHQGNVDDAIESQMQAWMLAGAEDKPEYRRVLDNYRQSATGRSARGNR